MVSMRYYVLVDREPVAIDDLHMWARQHQDIEQRRVARTEVDEQVSVSTVFLGTDHSYWGDGPPILFETMIFGGEWDQYCWRYCTWDAAQAGHDRIVAALRASDDLSEVDPDA